MNKQTFTVYCSQFIETMININITSVCQVSTEATTALKPQRESHPYFTPRGFEESVQVQDVSAASHMQ